MTPNRFSSEVNELYDKMMTPDNPIDAIRAVYSLAQVKLKDEALSALLKGLELENPELKISIIDILSQSDFFNPLITLPLAKLLKDPDIEVRFHAIQLLGSLKDRTAVPYLIQALNTPDEKPRIIHGIMASLANIGDQEASKALEKWAYSNNWKDRYCVADAIGMIADPRSIDVLLRLLKDSNPKVRENAAISVGHFDDNEIIKQLLIMFDDNIPAVRAAAVYMLGEKKSKSATRALLDLLKSESHELVFIALEAIGKIRDPITIPSLIKLIETHQDEIKVAAENTLDIFEIKDLYDPLLRAFVNDAKLNYLQKRIDSNGKNLEIPKSKKDEVEGLLTFFARLKNKYVSPQGKKI
jgi:HEAT repeat protein